MIIEFPAPCRPCRIPPASCRWGAAFGVLGCFLSVTIPAPAQRPGTLTTLAGHTSTAKTDPTGWDRSSRLPSVPLASQIELGGPDAFALDAVGNVYLASGDPSQIWLRRPDGILTHFAGTAHLGSSGDGGPASEAAFSRISGLALDRDGGLLVAEPDEGVIRRIGPEGIVTPFAGGHGQGFSPDGTPRGQVSLRGPGQLVLDAQGRIYFIEDFRLRRIDLDGRLTTVAGTGESEPPSSWEEDVPALSARLPQPGVLAIDRRGQIYVTDSGRVRRIGLDGKIRTVIEGGTAPLQAGAAPRSVTVPRDTWITVDADGTLYLAHGSPLQIWQWSPANDALTALPFIAEEEDRRNVWVPDGHVVGLALDGQGSVYVEGAVDPRDVTQALRFAVGMEHPDVRRLAAGDLWP